MARVLDVTFAMPQSIEDLTAILSGIPELTVTEPEPGFPVIDVQTPVSAATVALHGAQVLTWAPTDHPPVLYVSPKARMVEGTPLRGGIPICWPWFGNHPEDPEKPSHGFARTRFWELVSGEMAGKMATLVFKLVPDAETKALFPFDFELTATIRIADKLRVKLNMKNTGDEIYKVSSALHTYLSLGDIERIQLEGVKGSHYIDQLSDDKEPVYQEKNLQIKGEVDRIYQSMSSVLIRDLDRFRSVFVDKAGSRSTVIWNPWKETSKAIADLPDKGYKEFVCVECANAGTDKPTLRPNASHTLETVIGLRPLS
ncbi:D-hexose-6-phosphate mutarotase [bacterium]|nr:D-hexose-6-phosphate mutarotase [bacterium]MDB4572833.1 D-hexose-6-phosphate mutarotase [Akkermansiaceae bacterium]MDB4809417.1 D-hexose-6-phosphate mutarotase [bacterium]